MGATLQERMAAGEFGIVMVRPANPYTTTPGVYDVLLDDGCRVTLRDNNIDRELPDWADLLRPGNWLAPTEYDNAKIQAAQRAWAECGEGYPLDGWRLAIGGHILAWGKPPNKRRRYAHCFWFREDYDSAALEGIYRAASVNMHILINGQADRGTECLRHWAWVNSPYRAEYYREG